MALFRDWRLEAAEERFREAAALAPTAARLHNLATVRQLVGDLPAAEAGFRRALELEPENPRVRSSLGLVLLAQGRLREGFTLYDAWRQIPQMRDRAAPEIGVPRWRGEDVAGKAVLIWSEEGFGDQIMFARFAALLRAAGARLAWVCHGSLVRLIQECLGVQAVPIDARGEFRPLDYVIPSSALPGVFMQRMDAPPSAPYLRLPPANVIPGLSLGVVARGNPKHDNDRNRSLTSEAAAELMALPGAVSLAPEDTGARDFYDTATVIAGLDLVVTVDSAVAHLAGALGKPVWLLLPALGTDWRWMYGRSDTPWYPTMRLFRQTTRGDWRPVLAEVRQALGRPPR